MEALDLVRLSPIMTRTSGKPEIVIGLIDGPIHWQHLELNSSTVREIPGKTGGSCAQTDSIACQHGTFVAGVISAKRGSSAPSICPDCTLLVRPIFTENTPTNGLIPSAKPEVLAEAIFDCILAGAQIVNLSAAIAHPTTKSERALEEALNQAARRGVIVIAAAGNQGTLGGTAITRHPWVIPVVAYDLQGFPMGLSNIGGSIGRQGIGAPGDRVTSLGSTGKPFTWGGTSAAAPFVTGAIALLWSEFTAATAGQIKSALTQASYPSRASVVPPLLNADAAYQILLSTTARRLRR